MLYGTISQMTVCPWMNEITQSLFEFLIAGKVQRMSRSCPNCRSIQAPQRAQDSLCGNDSAKSIHHIPVAGRRVGLETLHSCLEKKEHWNVETSHLSQYHKKTTL